MRAGTFAFTTLERSVYGQPAAEALTAEAGRLGAQRVFMLVSGTMNRTTDEVARVREALGGRYAGHYDRMPAHTPRDAVLEATEAARAMAKAGRQDLVAAALGQPGRPAADTVAELVAELDQPARLADVGVTRDQFPLIASHTMKEHYIHTNPRKITHAGQVLEVLEAAA
jgi:alcohol dehydrogenase class IV